MLPKNCKTAKMIFIPKPGKDLKIPQSFYPIAFLSPLSKIYEPILFQHRYKLNFGVHVEKIRKKPHVSEAYFTRLLIVKAQYHIQSNSGLSKCTSSLRLHTQMQNGPTLLLKSTLSVQDRSKPFDLHTVTGILTFLRNDNLLPVQIIKHTTKHITCLRKVL